MQTKLNRERTLTIIVFTTDYVQIISFCSVRIKVYAIFLATDKKKTVLYLQVINFGEH